MGIIRYSEPDTELNEEVTFSITQRRLISNCLRLVMDNSDADQSVLDEINEVYAQITGKRYNIPRRPTPVS